MVAVPANGEPEHRVRVEVSPDPRTVDGELLFPALFTPAVVADAKKNPEMFAAQHQQDPIPPGGMMFKIADWRFWKPDGIAPDHVAARPLGAYDGPAQPLPKMEKILISVDGTFKKTDRGSFVAIHVWGRAGAGRYLLDRIHARMDYDTCERSLVGDRSRGSEHPIGGIVGRWPEAREKIVEDKANGPMLVNRLSSVLGVSGVIGDGVGNDGKEQRASTHLLPLHRAGNLYLPDGAPWLGEFIAEHASFPLGAHDDDVDAASQACKHLEQRSVQSYLAAMKRVGEVRLPE